MKSTFSRDSISDFKCHTLRLFPYYTRLSGDNTSDRGANFCVNNNPYQILDDIHVYGYYNFKIDLRSKIDVF